MGIIKKTNKNVNIYFFENKFNLKLSEFPCIFGYSINDIFLIFNVHYSIIN